MKYKFLLFTLILMLLLVAVTSAEAQCSICTRTAQQLGEKPARGLNAGILYLAFTPIAMMGLLFFRIYRKNAQEKEEEASI